MESIGRIVAPPVLAAALLAIAVGHGSTAAQTPPTGPGSLPEVNRMETHDEKLVRVEKLAPGFGGMFIAPDGWLAVYLIDPTRLTETRRAIEAVFGTSSVATPGVRALQGQYTVSSLKAWAERAGELLALSGVVMIDLDEGRNRVAVGVDDRSRTRAVEQALAALEIPLEAVVIDVPGPIRPAGPR